MKLTEALELLKDPEALRIRVAEADGWKWSIWNPIIGSNGCCYLDREGVFNERDIEVPRCENFNDGCPDYLTEASDIAEAERRLGLYDRSNTRLRVQWVNYLHDILGAQPGCPVNKVGTPVVSDIDKLLAPVEIRCAAFCMAAEWKAKQAEKEVQA